MSQSYFVPIPFYAGSK